MSRVTIITGAFGALGQGLVAEFAARGHSVAAVDKATPLADGAAAMMLGGVDLSQEASVASAYADIAGRLGPVTGLVNAAGGFIWEPVALGSLESWDRMYATNLKTAVASTRAVLPHLHQSGASIVNLGAAGAERPGVGMAPYAASKAGVRAFTESLADELKPRGVRVNAVLPTIIDTPANRADMPDADISAWVKPQAIARVIAFLLSDDAAAITGASLPLSLSG